MSSLAKLAVLFLAFASYGYAGVLPDGGGDPAQPHYEDFLSPGDKVVFRIGVMAFKYSDGAFLAELGDRPGEEEPEFLTTLYCDLGFKKVVPSDVRIPLKGEVFKVLAVEGQFGQDSSYAQSGVFVTIESESTVPEIANINLLVCLKQHHVEWPPKSGVHLQFDELGRLAAEGFLIEKK